VAVEADVLRDRDQPRRLGARDDAARERALREEERRLRRVLRVTVAQLRAAVGEDARPVALEQLRDCGCGWSRRRLDVRGAPD
jgi:hypothetical protein